ncbi:helix-turn-helix domain-containing protein [Hymenobacter sp.]|uniref:helix-turn-helix domain-containing protein n=1 Tax=Hymenobacter sp. TaxID=1898978 RepID=UPI0038D4A218
MLQHAKRHQATSRKQVRADQEAEAHRLQAQGLSIRVIAGRLGVPKTTVQNWLGRKEPTR